MQSIVKQQATLLQALLAILRREHEALKDNRIEELNTIVAEKVTLAEKLGACEEQLLRCLAADQVNSADRDVRDLITAVASAQHASLFGEVRSLIEQCNDLNNINGRMVVVGQKATGDLLRILKGQNDQGRDLYGNNGRTRHQSGANSLAKA